MGLPSRHKMKLNANTVLQVNEITLVPYLSEHVPRYHDWMQNEDLLVLTASEPLTIEQEFEMQKSWLEDDDKLTFIIHSKTSSSVVQGLEQYGGMIGDVNLFFNDDAAELEIMIADSEHRCRGFGKLVCEMMMSFAFNELGHKTYVVKIGLTNTKSIKLFKILGFVEESISEIFQEVTMKKKIDVSLVDYQEFKLS